MYRVTRKTTKNTEYKCLECKHCVLIDKEKQEYGQYVECNAENRCIVTSFNAKYYTCTEHKGFNDMSESELKSFKDAENAKKEKKAYKEYVFKYYPKRQAQRMYETKYGS